MQAPRAHLHLISAISFVLLPFTLIAQRTISGSISTADEGAPLPGVNILVKWSSIGSVSDIQGRYQIEVPDTASMLVISFVGYETQEIGIVNESVIDIAMNQDPIALQEVVITALGIPKEKRSLGYATQNLNGEDLSRVKDGNIVNGFAGKIAGLQVTGNTSSVGGSANMTLRGINSITGNNQPLFVVDGTPVDNSNYNGGRTQRGGGGMDWGNTAMDINPDDIETVTVLKGANAAALYGSRAANGVIMISTKQGSNRKGVGVTFSSSLFANRAAILPDYQNEYGGGYSQEFDVYNNEPIVTSRADESWGPRMEGQMVRQWHSWFPDDPDYGKMTPFSPHPNNVEDFYETGITTNNSLSFEGGNENTQFRLGYTHYRESGIIPNALLKRHTIALTASSGLTERLKVSTGINLISSTNDGVPGQGLYHRQGNVVTSFNMFFQRQLDMNKLKNYKTADGKDRSWNIRSPNNLEPVYWENPYWVINQSLQNMSRNRLYGNVSLSYKFAEGLTLQGWARADFYTQREEERIGSFSIPDDRYSESIRENGDTNFELLLRYRGRMGQSWSFEVNAGSNSRRDTYFHNNGATVGGLTVSNLFNLEASVDRPNISDIKMEKVVNSVYGSAHIGFKNMLFLDASIRNDWSSTLPIENNSYLYPSFSANWVFSELIASQWLTLGKLRASWAQVGNDTNPYQLEIAYSNEANYGDLPAYFLSGSLPNANLKPERINTWELGLETAFFKHRLGFDITYYHITSYDQILTLDVSSSSGFYRASVNAGEITNEGLELELNGHIIQSINGFNWQLGFNWAQNKNKVVSLSDGLTNRYLARTEGVFISATVGKPYGTFVTDGFEYHENGERIVDGNGIFRRSSNQEFGSYLPDWFGGIVNTFSYKGFSLYALIDFRKGGQVFSMTNYFGNSSGLMQETVGLNDRGNPVRDHPDEGGGIRSDGVFDDGTPNDIYVDARTYWDNMRRRREYYLYDASYVKLREFRFAYQFPKSLIGPFTNIDVALVGRNLLIIHKNIPHLDPETTYSAGNIQGFEGGQHPSIRSFGFSLELGI